MNWDPRAGEFPDDWYNEAFPIPGKETGEFTEATLREVFDAFDLDNKGYLSASDVRRVLNVMEEAVSDDDLDHMMLLMDPDGTGAVHLDHFLKGFLQPSPLFQSPNILPGSVAALPVRKTFKITDNVESELSRASIERKQLFDEVMSEGHLKPAEVKKIFGRFHELDKEKKGLLSYSNFLIAMQRSDSASSRRLFDLLDKDGNGELDLKEFILGLSQFTGASRDDRVRFTFKLFDSDNSGKLDREELTKIVRSAAPTSVQPQWIAHRVDELYESVGVEKDSLMDLPTFMELAKKNQHFIAPVVDELVL